MSDTQNDLLPEVEMVERLPWQQPEVRRLDAAAAELTGATASDGPIGVS